MGCVSLIKRDRRELSMPAHFYLHPKLIEGFHAHYKRSLLFESQLGSDSYPLYKRSSWDDGGQVSTISMRVGGIRIEQQVDNRWIVP